MILRKSEVEAARPPPPPDGEGSGAHGATCNCRRRAQLERGPRRFLRVFRRRLSTDKLILDGALGLRCGLGDGDPP